MRRPRLVVVSDYAWRTGGVEEFVFEFLTSAARVYDCRLVTWSSDVKTPPGLGGLRVVEFGDIRPLWAELDAAEVALIVTSFNVRLLAKTVGDYLSATRKPAVLAVQTSGHSEPDSSALHLQERWLTSLAEACHAVVAVSEEVAVALGQIDGFPSRRVVVIENAARLNTSVTRPRGRTEVSYIGRPHPQKGFHHFERLARELAYSGLRFSANTVSVAPTQTLPEISYTYLLSDVDLVQFFDAADLIVAPYLRADGLPLALLEAMNCGVPVVGFDVPGVGPLLKRHGQLVVEPTYEALRTVIEAWHLGLIEAACPTPGSVPGWSTQTAQYLEVIAEAKRQG